MAGDDVARKAARQRIFALEVWQSNSQHSIYSNLSISFRPRQMVELVFEDQLNHQ